MMVEMRTDTHDEDDDSEELKDGDEDGEEEDEEQEADETEQRSGSGMYGRRRTGGEAAKRDYDAQEMQRSEKKKQQ